MNYMKQVAHMLGVELDEEFKVEEYDDYTFKLTEDGLYWMGNEGWHSGYFSLTDILCDRISIIKNPILDAKEKEYLSNIIKPWRNSVKSISKCGLSNCEYLTIAYYDKLTEKEYEMYFPAFEKGTMYKGMEINKRYTLEDLML